MKLLIAFAVVFLSSCAYAPPIEIKPTPTNPTSYVFSAPFSKVIGLVDELCSKNRQESEVDNTTTKAIAPTCLRSSEFLACLKENSAYDSHCFRLYTPNYNPNADADLVSIRFAAIESRSYYASGKPLKAWGVFNLALKRISADKTEVSIQIRELEARNGTERGMHGAVVPSIAPLKPTTIEEYEVLLYLGKRLGESNMPPLKLPQ